MAVSHSDNRFRDSDNRFRHSDNRSPPLPPSLCLWCRIVTLRFLLEVLSKRSTTHIIHRRLEERQFVVELGAAATCPVCLPLRSPRGDIRLCVACVLPIYMVINYLLWKWLFTRDIRLCVACVLRIYMVINYLLCKWLFTCDIGLCVACVLRIYIIHI